MLVALAYVAAYFIHFPVVPAATFLKYDPKDVVIVLGGFVLGPIPCLIVATLTPLLEFATRNDSGIIGLVMNFAASASFCLPATIIYGKSNSFKRAALGLVVGTFVMTIVMLLFNYLLTPLYTNMERSEVLKLFLPALIPFNLSKGGINAAVTLLLFKPFRKAIKYENA